MRRFKLQHLVQQIINSAEIPYNKSKLADNGFFKIRVKVCELTDHRVFYWLNFFLIKRTLALAVALLAHSRRRGAAQEGEEHDD